MGNPVFSVCVPVYNAEKFLDACVNSVLSQTFTDFEVILVDDGSPDNSGVMCDNYSNTDSRIFTVHKDNGGQLSARIAAVEKARGEYIVFLDSDDTLEDNALEAIAKAFSHYDVDFVIYDMQRVINGVVQPPKKLHETMILESKRDIFKFVLASNKYNSLCIKCFKKCAFKYVDYSDYISIRHGEDLMQSIDLMSACDSAVVIPDVLYNYTFNKNSVSNNSDWMRSNSDYAVRPYVLEKLSDLGIFSESDLSEYQEYCISLLIARIRAIATASIKNSAKKELFCEIQDTEYYQTFLAEPKSELKSLGAKKWIYIMFTKKMYSAVILILNVYRKISEKAKEKEKAK